MSTGSDEHRQSGWIPDAPATNLPACSANTGTIGASYDVTILARREPRVRPVNMLMLALLNVCLFVIRGDDRDLTARQIAGFLIIYTEGTLHSVDTLAVRMNMPRSAVRCVMKRLAQRGLIVCERDAENRRCLLARRTPKGSRFFRKLVSLKSIIRRASQFFDVTRQIREHEGLEDGGRQGKR